MSNFREVQVVDLPGDWGREPHALTIPAAVPTAAGRARNEREPPEAEGVWGKRNFPTHFEAKL